MTCTSQLGIGAGNTHSLQPPPDCLGGEKVDICKTRKFHNSSFGKPFHLLSMKEEKMVFRFVILFIVLINISVVQAESEKIPLSVYYDATLQKHTVSKSYDTTADAYGYYYPNLSGGGWNYLDASMQTKNVNSPDDYLQKSFSLGYLEGYLTCNTIYTFYPIFTRQSLELPVLVIKLFNF